MLCLNTSDVSQLVDALLQDETKLWRHTHYTNQKVQKMF